MHGLGHHVGKNGNDALAAHSHQRQSQVVLAGVHSQLVAAQGHGVDGGSHIAVGFLGSHNVGVLGKLQIGLRLNVAAGAGRHIIQDNGGVHPVSHIGKVADQTALGGLVVIGGHHQQAVSAALFRGLSQLYRIHGVVAAGTGDNRYPVVDVLNGEIQHLAMLVVVQGSGFTGGAAGNNGVGALFDLKFNKPCQLIVIDLAILVHGGDNGNAGAGKNGLFHIGSLQRVGISPGIPLRTAALPSEQRRRLRRAGCCGTGRQT